MQNILDYCSQSLLFRNFIEVLMGLDNTLLLLIISLPIGFMLSLVFALGRVSKNKILSKPIAGIYLLFVELLYLSKSILFILV